MGTFESPPGMDEAGRAVANLLPMFLALDSMEKVEEFTLVVEGDIGGLLGRGFGLIDAINILRVREVHLPSLNMGESHHLFSRFRDLVALEVCAGTLISGKSSPAFLGVPGGESDGDGKVRIDGVFNVRSNKEKMMSAHDRAILAPSYVRMALSRATNIRYLAISNTWVGPMDPVFGAVEVGREYMRLSRRIRRLVITRPGEERRDYIRLPNHGVNDRPVEVRNVLPDPEKWPESLLGDPTIPEMDS
ncbi:hypothetical protein Hte_005872 [Hypoxylon texense]